MSYAKAKDRSQGSIAALVMTAISLAVALVLLLNRQFIVDQVNVWQYHPDSQVQSLAQSAGLSDSGKFYFYASQPSLDDRTAFNGHCSHQDASTAILGCYAGQKIYVYNITNPKLDGIQTVTASHEVLHAAYDRLSDQERAKLDTLLEAEYNKIKDDKSLTERMAFYAKTEPGERDNELHSVIGTEISNISPELEAYYKKYFVDRQKVVAMHTSYEAEFTQLQTRADQLTQQLNTLSSGIERDSKDYNAKVNQLNDDISSFNNQVSNGGFRSQSQFDSQRAALVSRAGQLGDFRTQVNAAITQYESLQKELASIASQSNELNRSINSSLAPAPSL